MTTTPRIIVEEDAADPREIVFDEDGRPLLVFGEHPVHGLGWTLWYLEADGNGVGDHFMPGELSDLDDVLRSAQQWLAMQDG